MTSIPELDACLTRLRGDHALALSDCEAALREVASIKNATSTKRAHTTTYDRLHDELLPIFTFLYSTLHNPSGLESSESAVRRYLGLGTPGRSISEGGGGGGSGSSSPSRGRFVPPRPQGSDPSGDEAQRAMTLEAVMLLAAGRATVDSTNFSSSSSSSSASAAEPAPPGPPRTLPLSPSAQAFAQARAAVGQDAAHALSRAASIFEAVAYNAPLTARIQAGSVASTPRYDYPSPSHLSPHHQHHHHGPSSNTSSNSSSRSASRSAAMASTAPSTVVSFFAGSGNGVASLYTPAGGEGRRRRGGDTSPSPSKRNTPRWRNGPPGRGEAVVIPTHTSAATLDASARKSKRGVAGGGGGGGGLGYVHPPPAPPPPTPSVFPAVVKRGVVVAPRVAPPQPTSAMVVGGGVISTRQAPVEVDEAARKVWTISAPPPTPILPVKPPVPIQTPKSPKASVTATGAATVTAATPGADSTALLFAALMAGATDRMLQLEEKGGGGSSSSGGSDSPAAKLTAASNKVSSRRGTEELLTIPDEFSPRPPLFQPLGTFPLPPTHFTTTTDARSRVAGGGGRGQSPRGSSSTKTTATTAAVAAVAMTSPPKVGGRKGKGGELSVSSVVPASSTLPSLPSSSVNLATLLEKGVEMEMLEEREDKVVYLRNSPLSSIPPVIERSVSPPLPPPPPPPPPPPKVVPVLAALMASLPALPPPLPPALPPPPPLSQQPSLGNRWGAPPPLPPSQPSSTQTRAWLRGKVLAPGKGVSGKEGGKVRL